MSKLLPPKLKLSGQTIDENIEILYDYFKNHIMKKDERPLLFGKQIYVDCKNWINFKSETFYHLISLSENENKIFNVFPCNNDISYSFCNENCFNKNIQVQLKSNNSIRTICLYRGQYLSWINDIIKLANNLHNNITYNIENNKFLLRYHDTSVDYLLVFDKINKDFIRLTSAYPVFYTAKKHYLNNNFKKLTPKMEQTIDILK